jgi:indole-3-acetate monooxygenase
MSAEACGEWSGRFRSLPLLMPRSLGGDEVEPLTACRVFEEAATQDGAVGWCAMIGATNGYFGGLLPTAGAREVYADRDVVLAGTFRPAGVAVAVDGGYRVAGRWPFASGIMHSHWLLGGCRPRRRQPTADLVGRSGGEVDVPAAC